MDLRPSITAAARGDSAARGELVNRFYPVVADLVHEQLARSFRHHHRWILPLFSTGDVVHDVLAEVLARPLAFAGNTDAEFAAYLASAVSHRLIDAVRRHHASRRDVRRLVAASTEHDPIAQAASHSPTPQTRTALDEQVAIFAAEMQRLTDNDRALIQGRLVDGLPFATIAAQLGFASDNSARKAFDRAHARLLLKLRAAGLRTQES